jgi:hypothetical protein
MVGFTVGPCITMHGPTDVKIVYELLDDVWRGGAIIF